VSALVTRLAYTGPTMPSRALIIEERITVPDAAFDHAGYRAWVTSDSYPDGIRTTFIQGEVLVEMSPESLERHNKVKAAISAALIGFVAQHQLGEVYVDGALVTNERAGLSCEPDCTFIAWATFDAGRVRFQPRVTHGSADQADHIEIVGSPDLVVEIVSDSSVKKDTRLLRDAYARAGVREYWLVDARGADVRFEILTEGGGSLTGSTDPGAPQESRVLGGRWQLSRTPNRAGRFDYRLDRME
jgi:Uma2 family endonuclease